VSDLPWPAGSATGIGSLPGTDIVEATKLVFGELPSLPHLPELPDRGPGAEMIGRGAAFLTDLPVELYAGRWRIASHHGLDMRRTLDLLERDIDTLTETADGYAGPLKVQAPGPWTLAANLDLPIGGRLLHDHGAARELAESLADGLARHVADVHRRVPGANVLLQIDEPSLPAVLSGQVPTESGLRTLRSVAATTAETALRGIVEAAGVPVVFHCCAAAPPLSLFRGAGAVAVSIDLTAVGTGRAALDALGGLLDDGLGLFAGVSGSASAKLAETVSTLWRMLGFPPARAAEQVVVTPPCGLAGASPTAARAALTACVEAGQRLRELQ